MKIIAYPKFVFYLILMTIVAFYGLKFSVYGLIVNIQNPEIVEFDIKNIENENFTKSRYLRITGASSICDPVVFIDDHNRPSYFIYALTSIDDSIPDYDALFRPNILIESKHEITDWNKIKLSGLLKPYWYTIDSEVISEFAFNGVAVIKNTQYMELDSGPPWKWYWHLLIIALVILFFYRMIEAILNKEKREDIVQK